MPRNDRLVRTLEALEAQGCEALLVTAIPNVRWLSGFTGSAANALVARGGAILFTDSRYELQARREARGFRVAVVEAREAASVLAGSLRSLGVSKLSFESEAVSYAAFRRLGKALGRACRLSPSPRLVERLRMVKDGDELALLSRLARMTDRVFASCVGEIREGMAEREIVSLLERLAREEGAEEPAFRPIVAAGAHGAMPHYRGGGGKVRHGRPLIIDFGLRACGYNSDLTRTFCLGTLPPRYREVYDAVFDAQKAALEAIKPGVPASAVDAGARELLSSRGFGAAFGHSLGHGLGLEVHEAPRLGKGNEELLREGMVVTVEPGVYLPGWGGVRLEDMAVVTAEGCRTLTAAPKDREASQL